MALVRQRSRSQLRPPLTIELSQPESRRHRTGMINFKTVSQLELALAKTISQLELAFEANRRPGKHTRPTNPGGQNIDVKIYYGKGFVGAPIWERGQTCIDINNEHALSFSGQIDPNTLGSVAHEIVTRYDVYEIAASPVGDSKQTGQFAAVYRRKNVVSVDPFIRIRERCNLQKLAAEGESLRAMVNRMKALYGTPNCFLGNTAFRQPDGSFKRVSDLEVGGTLCLESGECAQITHAMALPSSVQDLVELTTDQASLRVSANHPVRTLNGPRVAKDLRLGNEVAVGQRIKKLTRVTHHEEGAVLFDIRFNPDGPIQAYVIPNYGIQVHGAAPPDSVNWAQLWQQVSADELMAAVPQQYED